MCSRPAAPNIHGAGGKSTSEISASAMMCLSIGCVRSSYVAPSEPGFIFSNPSAMRALGQPAANRLGGKVQRGRPGRTVVVDVDDRDTAHAQLVERPLPRGRLAVDVPDVALLDRVVVDAGVLERLGAGLAGHVRVVPALATAGLLELRHPDTDDVDLVRHRTPSDDSTNIPASLHKWLNVSLLILAHMSGAELAQCWAGNTSASGTRRLRAGPVPAAARTLGVRIDETGHQDSSQGVHRRVEEVANPF